jgi:hypothetical protein
MNTSHFSQQATRYEALVNFLSHGDLVSDFDPWEEAVGLAEMFGRNLTVDIRAAERSAYWRM